MPRAAESLACRTSAERSCGLESVAACLLTEGPSFSQLSLGLTFLPDLNSTSYLDTPANSCQAWWKPAQRHSVVGGCSSRLAHLLTRAAMDQWIPKWAQEMKSCFQEALCRVSGGEGLVRAGHPSKHLRDLFSCLCWSEVKVAQPCLTPSDPTDYPAHGIL